MHAGVSTDAYHAPKDGLYPHICDGKDNEVETTYLDEEFLASQFKYVLKVRQNHAACARGSGTTATGRLRQLPPAGPKSVPLLFCTAAAAAGRPVEGCQLQARGRQHLRRAVDW